MNSAGVSIYNVDVENEDDRPNELNDLLNNAKIHILEQPNMGALRKERIERDRTAMKIVSPSVANHVMGKGAIKKDEAAAVCIQRHFRGYIGRKEYLQLLYEQFEKDEAERLEKIRQQVEEGEIIVDNYHLKQEMEENDCLRRNKRRQENCSAVTIQRVWRDYSERMHNKLVGLKNEHGHGVLKNGDNGVFISFAVSPFEDDFYEEDIFQNHSECEEHSESSSDEEYEDGHESCYSESEHKPDLYTGYLRRSFTENSESVDLNKELPPPTTDWESIDHRLNSSGIQTTDTQYSPDPKVINRLSIGPDYLQLCFGDDNALSDEGETHHEEAEIKEYIIEDYHASKSEDEDKRDSGCILKDDGLNLEPVDVKIIKPEELESTEISEEETTQVLLQLESVSEPHVDGMESDLLRKKLERFSIRHLETQIRDLKMKVKEASDELVNELLVRDQLHTRQDALLMDVEDAVKYAQTKHKLSKKLSK